MGHFNLLWLCCLTWSLLILGTHQLQSSQTQVLLQLRKHLEYPKQLEIWNDHGIDFCSISSSTQVNVTCQNNFVTELKIMGDKTAKVSTFDGFAIGNVTLSENFSMDSFITTLARLTSLRVLSLLSLGIWGPFPDKIHRLSSLEYLDLSSNFLFGPVPPKISTMVKLQTLIVNDNFFNDTIPNWFDSLSNLAYLSLRKNKFKGSFPTSIQRITTISNLDLSANEISGSIPDLSGLSSLNVLNLSENKLDSDLPTLPKGLVMVFLSNNSFFCKIPEHYKRLNQLQHLDMSFNTLKGILPVALFSLPNISYLNLASNLLSGPLPKNLNCGASLGFVDVSNNRLTGELPSCFESDTRVVKFGGNCLSSGAKDQHEESYCLEVHMERKARKKSGGKNVGILAGVVVGVLTIMVLLAFGFLVVCRRYYSRGISEQHLLRKAVQDNSAAGFSSDILTSARFISDAAKLGSQGLPACRPFTLEELKEATSNFDNSTFMGESSYGKLHKGRLENGTQVVIRCLPSSKKYTTRNLKLRLDLLAKLRHPHLVCLLGHCIDGGGDDYTVNKVFLIYEYVPNGNFRTLLSENTSGEVLNWSERLAVVIGVAKAVHFLHTGVIPGFFNNRLKTNNILLDEYRIAKLSDYGLSIVSEEISNIDDKQEDWKSRQMTKLDDDVFSFGFLLLESVVGPSVCARRGQFLRDELESLNSQEGCRRIVNPVVMASSSQESLSIVISIANKCICSESWSRPSFEDILWNLQYAAQVQATAGHEQRF